MTFTNTELGELLDLLRSKSVYRFKANGLEVEFGGFDGVSLEETQEAQEPLNNEPMSDFEMHTTFTQL